MESDNKSGGAAADAAAAGGSSGGRLLVEELFPDVQNDRTRFEIELKHGETTIVSWAKLLEDSGMAVDQSPPPSPQPPPLHQEDESRIACSNIILKNDKDEQNCRPNKQRTAVSQGMNFAKNTKIGKSIAVESQTSEVNSGIFELPDLNVPYKVQAASILPTQIKDGSMLESSILEMEAMVADCDLAHHLVSTKSRLPRQLKEKLEIVAKLAHLSQGRISDELILRLMSILGNWLKPRTLNRWLRDMVPSACGGDAVRFTQIKKEVTEMIKLRNPLKDNETMELHAANKTKYSIDHEMEDKICDFYDIYVQGMDQVKSSEIRKFYIQVAGLWPNGTMDNHGIRNAICSSKQRRRTALQQKDNVVPGTPELDRNLSEPANR